MEQATDIARVIRITDTRQYIEVDDRWIPVPGSGDVRPCDRCDRDHEVHAYVELVNGDTSVIGTGCARGSTMLPALRRGASRAKNTAKRQHQLAALRAEMASAETIIAEVESLTPPDAECDGFRECGDIVAYRMGDASVWCPTGFDEERARTLLQQWRRARTRERGMTRDPYSIRFDIEHLETLIARAKARAERDNA